MHVLNAIAHNLSCLKVRSTHIYHSNRRNIKLFCFLFGSVILNRNFQEINRALELIMSDGYMK